MQTHGTTGPATVVRVIDHDGMSDGAERLVRALGLSGLCGLDFVIESGTGLEYLIEMNLRATPTCHLSLGTGRDLPAALCAWVLGKPLPQLPSAIANERIALFPGECQRDPRSTHLSTAHHDVPWVAMDLVRDGLDLPWEQRGYAARLRAWVKSRRATSEAPAPARAGPRAPDRVR